MCFRPPEVDLRKKCPSCGAENPDSAMKCGECGAEFPEAVLYQGVPPVSGAPKAPGPSPAPKAPGAVPPPVPGKPASKM